MEIIKFFEGCHLEAYQDTAGIWTIGFGSTKGVKQGMKITEDEASKLLDRDLQDAEQRVIKALGSKAYTKGEWQALVSLAFNLRSFEKLASHLKKDKELFKKKMLLYCKDVKGNDLKGLKIRRIAERLLFEGKEWIDIVKDLQKQPTAYVKEKEQELFLA